MNIGVLTSSGIMYLIQTQKKIKEEDLEEFVCKTVDESAGNLNWQVLDISEDSVLDFRMMVV